jgi:hypothetical protein
MKYMTKQFIIFILPLLLQLSCSSTGSDKIQLLGTQDGLQEEVNRFIKVGMPIQKAKQIMEASGFECKNRKNRSFALEKRGKNGRGIGETTSIEGDFLSCSVTHYYIIGSTGWWVSLLYKDNRVSLVYAVVNHQSL